MTTWHRATIKFQYSPKTDLNHRSITQVTTPVTTSRWAVIRRDVADICEISDILYLRQLRPRRADLLTEGLEAALDMGKRRCVG